MRDFGRINAAKRNRADWEDTMKSFEYFRLYKEGKTISEIASEFGVTEQHVTLRVNRRLKIEESKNNRNDKKV